MSVDLYSRKRHIGSAGEEYSFTPEQRKGIYKRSLLLLPLIVLFVLVGVFSCPPPRRLCLAPP
jgi:hypothetical protein